MGFGIKRINVILKQLNIRDASTEQEELQA